MKTASANLWCVVAEGVLQCSDILEAVAGHHAVVMVRGHREHRGILHTVLTLWHADIVQRRETIQVPVVVSNIFALFFVGCACNGSRSCTVHSTQATRCNYNWRNGNLPNTFSPFDQTCCKPSTLTLRYGLLYVYLLLVITYSYNQYIIR